MLGNARKYKISHGALRVVDNGAGNDSSDDNDVPDTAAKYDSSVLRYGQSLRSRARNVGAIV